MKTPGLFCLLFLSTSLAVAQVPLPVELSEQFDYTIAALSGQGSWSATGSGSSTISVVSGNLTYTGYSQSVGAQVELSATSGEKTSRRPLPTTLSNDNVYAYFLVRFSAVPSSTQLFFALRNAAGTTEDGQPLPGSRPLKVSARAGLGGTVELGLRKRGGTRTFASSKLLNINTTYLIAASYQFNLGLGDDIVKLWVNPATLPGISGEPLADASTTSGNDGVQITGVTVRESSTGGTLLLDDVTVKHVDPSLPVSVSSLSATADGSDAVISWTMTGAFEDIDIDVEREVDGQFVSIGQVRNSIANATRSHTYRATDLPIGQHRFRLRSLDDLGTAFYSSIIEVSITGRGIATLDQPYPNPFGETAGVRFSVAKAGSVSLRLYDMLGREVQVVHDGEAAADQPIEASVDGSALAPGVYVLRLTAANINMNRLISKK